MRPDKKAEACSGSDLWAWGHATVGNRDALVSDIAVFVKSNTWGNLPLRMA